ncbi:MAG: Sua5/YciO/YrdC/YwlC family protein [Gammaproteobacteria bacterium]|nr:Sua5/YciO/YrdC/YwlC family protein [Gammaproteobacteria bacterium]MBQ0840903.1 Sua5/YciO/YrdC/YwlC family protein [Gammaproteobacteria bacterium]
MRDLALRPGIRLAAASLHKGGIVAYPTEAVWGLGCDPKNDSAVQHLLALKKRDPGKGLILIAADIAMFTPYLRELEPAFIAQLQNSWPGAITWLIPNNQQASPWISGGRETLALRVTAHPVASALSRAFGGPLVSTSANPQGLPPAKSLTKVKAYFGNTLDAYAPGSIGNAATPSEIRNLATGDVIRAAG